MSGQGLTKDLLSRPRCALLGCLPADLPCCGRCGADLYSGDFIETALLDPFFRLAYRIRNLVRRVLPKRCEECGKRFVRGFNGWACSEKCFDKYLPF